MATTEYGSSMTLLNEPRTTTHSYENTVKTPAYENMIYWTPDQGYRYSDNGGGYSSISNPGQEYKPKPMPEYQREYNGDYGYTPDPSPSSLPSDYEYSDMQSLINAMRRDGIDVDKIVQEAKAMNLNHMNLNLRNRNWNDKSLFDVGSQDDKSLFDTLKQYYTQYRDARRIKMQERIEQIRDWRDKNKINRENFRNKLKDLNILNLQNYLFK